MPEYKKEVYFFRCPHCGDELYHTMDMLEDIVEISRMNRKPPIEKDEIKKITASAIAYLLLKKATHND